MLSVRLKIQSERVAKSTEQQLDAGEIQPGESAFQAGFEVLGEAAVTIEPSQGALDHPAPGQDRGPVKISRGRLCEVKAEGGRLFVRVGFVASARCHPGTGERYHRRDFP